MARLGPNRYGKAGVRLVTVRRGAPHEVRDWTVDVSLSGDFDAAHVEGDNREILPTDTMKNAVYVLAARLDPDQPEDLGLALTRHFLDRSGAVAGVEVTITQHPWSRLSDGTGDDHAFVGAQRWLRSARVAGSRQVFQIEAGIRDLLLLKTTGSAFRGFARDELTTLPEAEDRLLATALEAIWRYGDSDVDFDREWEEIRTTLVATFAEHDASESVQHTAYHMGETVLSRHPVVEEIRLTLPNLHHYLVELESFGLDNPGLVYRAADRPYGLIEATVIRSDDPRESERTSGS